ncbi:hypothetical protein AGQ61_24485 [Salmonella enterica subsp. enterica]|nr:hypothetical protein AGQ51_24485 [Salmonella enterica subsp. enterica]KYB78838.1 hypothetical protein AGQ61_24485 [Salmonella enterica subsp. enterica]
MSRQHPGQNRLCSTASLPWVLDKQQKTYIWNKKNNSHASRDQKKKRKQEEKGVSVVAQQ